MISIRSRGCLSFERNSHVCIGKSIARENEITPDRIARPVCNSSASASDEPERTDG
jgi:hypothetical protein